VTSREPSRADINELTGPLLLEFGASWCPHCQVMRQVVAGLLRAHPEVRHIRVEDGPGQPLGRSFRVKLWPNFVLMRDGKVVRQLARPAPGELEDAIREALGIS
jgi:thioredoxin 1